MTTSTTAGVVAFNNSTDTYFVASDGLVQQRRTASRALLHHGNRNGGFNGQQSGQGKGVANKAIGKVKQGIGETTDDEALKGKGRVQEAKGEVQHTVGKAKDAIKKAADL